MIALITGFSSVALAQQSATIEVSATVQPSPPGEEPIETIVNFQGYAYPQASVNIYQNGTKVAETTANSSAEFSTLINDLSAGNYTFGVQATDQNGVVSSIANFSLSVSRGQIITISNIFLGPTIAINKSLLYEGQTLTISGASISQETITVSVQPTSDSSNNTNYYLESDSRGNWSKEIVHSDLEPGAYTVKAKGCITEDNCSYDSYSLFFTVKAPGEEVPPEEPKEPKKPEKPEIPVDRCETAIPGDVNCDGIVNIVDVSMLLFLWNSTQSDPKVDLNKNGIVDAPDFSILLYYWNEAQ